MFLIKLIKTCRDDVCPQRFVTSESEHLPLGVNACLQSRDDVCPQRVVTSESEHLPLGVNAYLQSRDDVCPQRVVTSESEHLPLGTGRRHPPVLRNHPPVSGAIFWERSLFNRLKRSVLIFQKVEELKDSALKTEAFAAYLKIAKAMKSFEDSKYDQWITRSVPIVQTTLNKNVLKMIHYDRERGVWPSSPLNPLIPQSSEKATDYLLDKEGNRENKECSQEVAMSLKSPQVGSAWTRLRPGLSKSKVSSTLSGPAQPVSAFTLVSAPSGRSLAPLRHTRGGEADDIIQLIHKQMEYFHVNCGIQRCTGEDGTNNATPRQIPSCRDVMILTSPRTGIMGIDVPN
uniref:Dynein heavy chain tail domain-containing protein n=1 Tax=Timema poppense TaxID=170557 RepID=A0A7R9DBM8_TIMPO|nr:unnamed protein product [Timema poppensis]